jgi:hypothetical protein
VFDNYLSDRETYLNLENFFIDFFISKLEILDKNRNVFTIPFYKTTFQNGEPFMDGNPIFSVKNEINGEILRVIIDENNYKLELLNKKSEFGKELVVIGNITMLDDIKEKIDKWLGEYSHLS